jgi:hypothetical protein
VADVRGMRSRLCRERRGCESKRKRGRGERVAGGRSEEGRSRWSAWKSVVSLVSIRRLKGKGNDVITSWKVPDKMSFIPSGIANIQQ